MSSPSPLDPPSADPPSSAAGAGKRVPDPPAAVSSHVDPPHAGKRVPDPPAAVSSHVDPPVDDGTRSSRLASGQQGAVTRSQLLGAGISRHRVDRRARNGHLHRVHWGVYIVGHLAFAPLAREKAALLACGEGSVIGHWSAAFLHRLTDDAPGVVHVIIAGRHCRPKQGVHVHKVSELDARDITGRSGIPLTAPARTLIDIAASATAEQLEALVSEARARNLLPDGELEAALTRAGRRAGVGAMRAFLEHEATPDFTRSEAERRMRRLARAAGLPVPRMNTPAAGWEVDFLWPAKPLVVEVDGFGIHKHRAAFERDRRKGMALVAAGYRVIRITWRQLVHEPLFVAAQLAQALAIVI